MKSSASEAVPTGTPLTPDELDLARLIVTTLNLEVAPEEIAPLEPIYGEGLGLDSIDILEVALVVAKHYGVQLRSDDVNAHAIYASLRSLNEHIHAHRTT